MSLTSGVYTDLSGTEPPRWVGIGRVVTSGSLGGVMDDILGWNERDVCSIPAVGEIFPIFINPHPHPRHMTMILYKLCSVLLLKLPCVSMHYHCLYVMGLDKSKLIDRWRCDATLASEVTVPHLFTLSCTA